MQNTKHCKSEVMFLTIGHEIWKAFNNDQLLGREEEAHGLKEAAAAETARQAVSARDRAKARAKHDSVSKGSPPTELELQRCKVYLDSGVQLPAEWHATFRKHNATITCDLHLSTVFVTGTPWNPVQSIITWAAVLSGAWVITPACFVGKPGASVKYKPSIFLKRRVWASESFKSNYRQHWIVLLEILKAYPTVHSWKMLLDADQWATARAHAERTKRKAEVIALVGPGEATAMHDVNAFDLNGAMEQFANNVDKSRGSIGLINM
jgi:hypothetical protein